MKKHEYGYILSNGRIIYANNNIIGITEDSNNIYTGYDGIYYTEIQNDVKFIDLQNSELKEIALYMSDVWKNLAEKL